ALLAIWREVLGHDTIGVTDNFFEVGGDSILAMRMVSRIQNLTSHEITISDIFTQKTISNLLMENNNYDNKVDRNKNKISSILSCIDDIKE
ncbi:phosphopantetheine-binding protein, partial [Acetobacter senegalensis]|uniref:phosphopantetheine-binding protein n=1 Tax=Acetobacter senegalensis TaxID=446692 RepID=UPI0020A0327A